MKKSLIIFSIFLAFCMITCQKDQLKKNRFEEDEIILSIGEKYTPVLVTVPSKANLPDCSYSSDDKIVATVNKSTGEITAKAVGEAVITAKTTDGKFFADCLVTVISGGDESGLYKEPYLTFGANKTAVKNYETRKLAGEEANLLAFDGENNDVLGVIYTFESNKMVYVYVFFNNTTHINVVQLRLPFLSFDSKYFTY